MASRAERLEKFSEEILRDAKAVVGGGANVVDRRDFAGERFARLRADRRRKGLPTQQGFGLGRADGHGSDTAECDANVGESAVANLRGAGQADLRDGLRAASANLAVIL